MKAGLGIALRAIVALLGVVALQAPVAAQGCWYDIWGYEDWYDNGIDTVYLYGDAFDDSFCPLCPHSDYTLVLAAQGPNGSAFNTFPGESGFLPLGVQTSGPVSYSGDFELFCPCAGPISQPLFGGVVQVTRQPPQLQLSVTQGGSPVPAEVGKETHHLSLKSTGDVVITLIATPSRRGQEPAAGWGIYCTFSNVRNGPRLSWMAQRQRNSQHQHRVALRHGARTLGLAACRPFPCLSLGPQEQPAGGRSLLENQPTCGEPACLSCRAGDECHSIES